MTEDKHESIDKMTVKELRDLAKECDVTGTSGMKKDELLASIKAAKGIVDEKPQAAAPKKVAKKGPSAKKAPITSVRECKALINVLRSEKITAKSSGDQTTVEVLRRRINVLKKKSRKFKKAV
jgi:hypothetical protein